MLKRVWRFLALLSVTPIVTVVCVVALGWMSFGSHRFWDIVSRYPQLAQKIAVLTGENDTQADRPEPLEPLGFRGTNRLFLVEVESGFRQVSEEHAKTAFPEYIRIASSNALVTMGTFAITRVVQYMDVEVVRGGQVVSDVLVQDRVSYKLSQSFRYRHFAQGARAGLKVRTEHFLVRGHLFNAAGVLVCAWLLFSLQWCWKGVRWPWGSQRAWKRAEQGDRAVSITAAALLLSPFTTLAAILACLWIVAGNLQSVHQPENGVIPAEDVLFEPQYPGLLEALRAGLLATGEQPLPGIALQTPQSDQSKTLRSSLTATEVKVLDKWNGQFVYEEPKRLSWLAPMYEPAGPYVWMKPVPQSADEIEALESVFIAHAATHLKSPRWTTTDPWRDNGLRVHWGAVIRNAALVCCFVIGIVSCLWLIDGFVWPWQVRRLRQGACLQCGYSLAGLSAEKCPECGAVCASPGASLASGSSSNQ